MNRTGLIVALALAVITGLLFGLFPQLDLAVSAPFHDYVDKSHNVFAWRIYRPVMLARNVGLWVGALLVAPAVVALIVKLAVPRRKMLVSGRAVVFLISTLVLAPPPWRALAYAGALALGAGMAAIRIMAGAHFLSDVVFAGVFTFLIVWFMYALIYRWPRTRLSDEAVERALERISVFGWRGAQQKEPKLK